MTLKCSRAELAHALGYCDCPLSWEVIIARGEAPEVVIKVAKDLDCQLIVTGIERNELLGRVTPGRCRSADASLNRALKVRSTSSNAKGRLR